MLSGRWEAVLVFIAIYIILAWSLWLPLRSGQFYVPQPGFAALGAYFSGYATANWHLPFAAGLLIAVSACMLLSALWGLLMLRVKGLSVAIATIGFFLIVSVVFLNLPQFGASYGLHGIPFVSYMLPLAAATVLVVLLMLSRLMGSRLGRAIEAMHDDEEAASALGVNVNGMKMFVFVASGMLASLGGVYYAHYVTYMAPSIFTFSSLISIFVFAVVGGFTTFWGPLVGTIVLWSLPEFIRPLAAWRTIAFTSILILVVILRPHGLLSKYMVKRAGEALTRLSRRMLGKNAAGTSATATES